MKVTILQPASSLLLENKVMPNLGILFLSAWLRKHGHEPSVIDLAGVDDWQERLRAEQNKIQDASWVGLSCTSPQYSISKAIRDYIKSDLGYDLPIACGGMHVTSLNYAHEMGFLQTDGFDSYCLGEGYNAVTKMCNDLKEEGRLRKVYVEPVLKDINELPFAARDLVDIKSYKYKLGDVSASTMYSQYGCYYECSYCESKMAGSFVVRMMNAQRIYDEILHGMIEPYQLLGTMMFDDELNLNRHRMMDICEKFKAIKKDYKDFCWRGFLVVAKTDEEMFKAMKESGCYECATGIESMSPKILLNIRKPATVEQNMRFIHLAKKAGLRVKVFMIMGLPGEDWSTVRETDEALSLLK